MTDADRILSYLFENGQGWGPSRGVEPMLLEDSMALPRAEFGEALTQLGMLGLIVVDMVGTRLFSDPVGLAGVRLLNVYLTEEGYRIAEALASQPRERTERRDG